MDKKQELHDQIEMGRQASLILENPVWKAVCENLEVNFIEQIAESCFKSDFELRNLAHMANAVKSITAAIEEHVATAEMATLQLAQLDNMNT